MSTDPDWLYRGLLPLTADRRQRLDQTRRYADAPLAELPVTSSTSGGVSLMQLADGDGVVRQGEIDAVLANYWPTSPWLELTCLTGLGTSNVVFALTNVLVKNDDVEL